MDSKTTSKKLTKENIMDSKPERLWDWKTQMAIKYPNERMWDVLSRWIMDYEQTFTDIRRILGSIQRDIERDLENMSLGYEPMSLGFNSNAERLTNVRNEMSSLSDRIKSMFYVLGIEDADRDLFWELAQAAMKNQKGA